MDIQAVKVPSSDRSRRIIHGVVLVLDLIAIALAAVVVSNLRGFQDGDEETISLGAVSCARAIIAKSVVSLGLMVALFLNKAGSRKETIIALVPVTTISIVLAGLGAYSIHEADQLVALNSAGSEDLAIFKAAGALQIIVGIIEIISFVVSILRTPSV